jgi:hypothetical protein
MWGSTSLIEALRESLWLKSGTHIEDVLSGAAGPGHVEGEALGGS